MQGATLPDLAAAIPVFPGTGGQGRRGAGRRGRVSGHGAGTGRDTPRICGVNCAKRIPNARMGSYPMTFPEDDGVPQVRDRAGMFGARPRRRG